jgi:polyisoprenoid-binding protein YceI
MKIVPALIVALAFAAGCKKDEAAPPAPTATAPTTGSGSAAAAPTPAAEPAPVANADHITVLANHEPAKPGDPVAVKFEKFTVTKAAFDPANLEGGTATIELDLASISSGSEKRDGHLKTPSYIDLAKFTTATIDVANVKKQGDKGYTADAKVKFRDIEKTYPVTFEVVEATADSVRIKGQQKFTRADFKVGTEPGPEESVAKDLEIQLQLTLKKT